MEKREFILKTLLPYRNDPSTCGFDVEEASCCYLDPATGNRCAVGKHIADEHYLYFKGSVYDLALELCSDDLYEGVDYDDLSIDYILTPEAKAVGLEIIVWEKMQLYHDKIANPYFGYTVEEGVAAINAEVDEIEELTDCLLPELRVDEQMVKALYQGRAAKMPVEAEIVEAKLELELV